MSKLFTGTVGALVWNQLSPFKTSSWFQLNKYNNSRCFSWKKSVTQNHQWGTAVPSVSPNDSTLINRLCLTFLPLMVREIKNYWGGKWEKAVDFLYSVLPKCLSSLFQHLQGSCTTGARWESLRAKRRPWGCFSVIMGLAKHANWPMASHAGVSASLCYTHSWSRISMPRTGQSDFCIHLFIMNLWGLIDVLWHDSRGKRSVIPFNSAQADILLSPWIFNQLCRYWEWLARKCARKLRKPDLLYHSCLFPKLIL